MNGYNKVIILGTLGADPEIRYTQSGEAVANISAATSEKWKDKSGNTQEKTEWHRIVLFGKHADLAKKYLSKGHKALFDGKLQTRKWQDSSGADRYTTEIIANRVEFVGQLSSGQAVKQSDSVQDNQESIGFSDDNIPF